MIPEFQGIIHEKLSIVVILFIISVPVYTQSCPQPGDIYREYAVNLRSGNNWRVTDPNASHPGAQDFLPNPILNIQIDDLENAVEAKLYHRTWNAGDDHDAGGSVEKPLIVNDKSFKCYGKNHYFALSSVDIPVADLIEGVNTISYYSETEHHGIEILWPGPYT